jgi:hypothetical protein
VIRAVAGEVPPWGDGKAVSAYNEAGTQRITLSRIMTEAKCVG